MTQTSGALWGAFRDQAYVWRRSSGYALRRTKLLSGAQPAMSARLDWLDTFVFLPGVWIASALGFAIGDYPFVFFLIPPMCVIYAIARRTIPPRLLTIYVMLCVVAGVLSWYRFFPPSWQIAFLAEAIPRQLAPIISFFAVSWAAKAYFLRRFRTGDILAAGNAIMFLAYVVAPAIMFVSGVRYEGDDETSTILAAYGSFINNITLGLFFILGHLFFRRDSGRYVAFSVLLLVAATTHFVQFKLVTLAAIVMLAGFPPRLVILAIIGALIASYSIEAYNIPAAVAENPDKGIRVAFIADSFESLADTSGAGIGYGTESVRWVYRFPGQPDFTFMPDPRTISKERLLEVMSRGVHNSFAQAMLRMGVVGLVLLTWTFFCAFPPSGIPRAMQSHAAALFICMFIACFVNPALESARQLIGLGFSYGYLLALRSSARRLRASKVPQTRGPDHTRTIPAAQFQ